MLLPVQDMPAPVYEEAQEADPNIAYPQGYEAGVNIDLTFVYTLAEDPYHALQIAKNKSEVDQAKQAIVQLEAVSTYNIKKRDSKILVRTPTLLKQARNEVRQTEELPDIPANLAVKKGRKIKIPAPKPQKTAGFTPSSARGRGRGSRGGRGGRGRGAKTTPRGKKAASDTFDVSASTISLESDSEPDDPSQPKLARVRALVNKKTKAAIPAGEVQTVNALVKDGEGRVPEPQEVPSLTVQDVMPSGEKDQVDINPDMVVNVRDDKKYVDFILVQDHHVIQANGKPKGMSLLEEETFRPIVNKAIVNTVTINMDWCRVVKRSVITEDGLPCSPSTTGTQMVSISSGTASQDSQPPWLLTTRTPRLTSSESTGSRYSSTRGSKE